MPRFRGGDVLVAHALFVAGRLKAAPGRPLFDVLELFAFVRPAQPCVPSPLGLARALGLPAPAECRRGRAHAFMPRPHACSPNWPRSPKPSAPPPARWRPAWRAPAGAGVPSFSKRSASPKRRSAPLRASKPGAVCRNGKTKRRRPSRDRSRSRRTKCARALRSSSAMAVKARPEQNDYAEAATYAFGAARACRRAEDRADRSRHRHRQDAGLSRAGEPVGGEERPGPVALDLHAQSAAPDRAGDRAPLSRSRRARGKGCRAQGPRELSLPAELRGGRQAQRRRARPAQRRARPRRALGSRRRRTATCRVPAFPRFLPHPSRCARSPTAAANASIRPARIIAPASSSAPCAARAMRASSSPIMRS